MHSTMHTFILLFLYSLYSTTLTIPTIKKSILTLPPQFATSKEKWFTQPIDHLSCSIADPSSPKTFRTKVCLLLTSITNLVGSYFRTFVGMKRTSNLYVNATGLIWDNAFREKDLLVLFWGASILRRKCIVWW